MVSKGLLHLGFKEKEITTLLNPDLKTVKETFAKIMGEVFEGTRKDLETLLFVYFAGHGAQDNDTFVILNGIKQTFPLENILRAISKMKGSYVMSLLDCCRERIS